MIRRRGAPASATWLLLALAILTGSCTAADGRIVLTVYAAASLRAAIDEVRLAYEAVTPNVRILVATDSSTALRVQIEHGAPVDLYLSADTVNPNALADANLAAGSPVPFAGNSVALIVPMGNPADIGSPVDLANDGVRIVAGGDAVPITAYVSQVLTALAALPGYPADFIARYRENIVSTEDNVRAIGAKIELAEGDAGFVYQTDARASGLVTAIPIPAEARATATYSGVVIGSSAHREEAGAFLSWLAGPGGRAVLAEFGFTAP